MMRTVKSKHLIYTEAAVYQCSGLFQAQWCQTVALLWIFHVMSGSFMTSLEVRLQIKAFFLPLSLFLSSNSHMNTFHPSLLSCPHIWQ